MERAHQINFWNFRQSVMSFPAQMNSIQFLNKLHPVEMKLFSNVWLLGRIAQNSLTIDSLSITFVSYSAHFYIPWLTHQLFQLFLYSTLFWLIIKYPKITLDSFLDLLWTLTINNLIIFTSNANIFNSPLINFFYHSRLTHHSRVKFHFHFDFYTHA